ncbi:MAG: rpfG 2 [Firmicutes bacterium]|nr:rpfG 2 [Bacillota bacterium]
MHGFQFLFSIRSKLFFTFFSLSALITMTVAYSLYGHMRADHINTLSRGIMNIASVTAMQLDGDALEQMVDPVQENLAEYMDIKKKLNNIADEIPEIKYIYTMRKTDQPGQYAFIVDADPDAESVAHIGDLYDGSKISAMAAGFVAPSADQDFSTDQWGTTISGYAPIRNSNHEIVGIVGIDIDADTMVKGLANVTYKVIYQSVIVIILCAVVIFIIANSFARRFQLINKAIDEIASGNCDIDLVIDGGDAIARLSARINNLAATLHTEREEMLLSTITVLVNALEAKDKYTSGHSSEVESLTLEISKALRLPEKEIFNITIAATLHDIGKIGIPDKVLHKQGKLTEEEWFLIKQHPYIGAMIIADIPSLQVISQIVMHHHARWDGKGYPQSLSGGDIPIGARIIAVADSFQAMVSDRPYRKGMPIEEALAEIRHCAGTQFDPEIVDAFFEFVLQSGK